MIRGHNKDQRPNWRAQGTAKSPTVKGGRIHTTSVEANRGGEGKQQEIRGKNKGKKSAGVDIIWTTGSELGNWGHKLIGGKCERGQQKRREEGK